VSSPLHEPPAGPVHFIGIGGAGMSGIAVVLARLASPSPAPT
jgi:UDP-N-acetylmuramate-alanine ligase